MKQRSGIHRHDHYDAIKDNKSFLRMMLQQGHPSLLVRMQKHKPLQALGSLSGESCFLWLYFLCCHSDRGCVFLIVFFFYHIAGVWEKDTHKQNHVMRGFCGRRAADVSYQTTHSWTLCNRAVERQCRSGRGMHDWIGCCKSSMWLLTNTMTGEKHSRHTIMPERRGKQTVQKRCMFPSKRILLQNSYWPQQGPIACNFVEHK